MNLFELFIKIGVDDEASDKVSTLSSKLGNGLKTAAKIGTTAVSAAAAGITALTTAAVNNYAEYEQLVGGVETLFKTSADTVQRYANDAYKTAGMSANDYMSTVTSFSASLLQSLEGDTEAASSYANQAIVDMADNANKMGTSIEMIQNAYQGFAKQNYTMLDNLKLGYGGTKTEMERLIADANAVKEANGEMANLSISSFADVTEAIHIIQTEMGITGTTALEASATISGSVASMKSAWQNLLTGIADGNQDFTVLVGNFVDSVGTAAGNILPRIEVALNGAIKLIDELIPTIMDAIPGLIENTLPQIVEAAVGIVRSIVDGISQNQKMITTTVIDLVSYIIDSFIDMLPDIIKLGLDIIKSLADGIAKYLPKLIPTVIDVVLEIVDILTDPQTLSDLIDASIAIIEALADGIIESLPELIDKAPQIVSNLVTAIVDNVPKLLDAAYRVIVALVTGIIDNLPQLGKAAGEIISAIGNGIINLGRNLVDVGKNIVSGIWEGITNSGDWLMDKVTGFFGGVIDGIKSFLGIASPAKVFQDDIGKMMAMGVGVGFDKEMGNVEKTIMSDFDKLTSGLNADMSGNITYGLAHGFTGAYGMAGANLGGVTINVNVEGTNSTAEDIAEAISEALQNMTDRRVAVYG